MMPDPLSEDGSQLPIARIRNLWMAKQNTQVVFVRYTHHVLLHVIFFFLFLYIISFFLIDEYMTYSHNLIITRIQARA